MKIYQILIITLAAFFSVNCGADATVTTKDASPTEVLKNYVEASKKKDVEGVKKTLSKNSLELAAKSAAAQKTTVDEMLRRDTTAMLDEKTETRNEKIEGDTATVEIKNRVESYDTIPFVKEGGAWKIALDKYQEMMLEKMRQEMKTPIVSNSASDTNKAANK